MTRQLPSAVAQAQAAPPTIPGGSNLVKDDRNVVQLLIDELTAAASCTELSKERVYRVFMTCKEICDNEECKVLLVALGWVENSLVVMKRLENENDLELLDIGWEILYFCAFEIAEEFGSRESGGAEILLHIGKAAARILRKIHEKGLWSPGLSCNVASLLYALWLEDGFQECIKKAFANGECALGVLVRDVRNDEEIEVEVVSLFDGLLKGGALATSGGGSDVERAIVGELAAKVRRVRKLSAPRFMHTIQLELSSFTHCRRLKSTRQTQSSWKPLLPSFEG